MIVAFGHQKNVGKDQFIKFIIDHLRPRTRGLKIVRRGFADKLYDLCHELYGWAGFRPRVYYQEHPESKKDMLATGKTVRETLIDLGQHMRAYDGDIWINAALKTLDAELIFISDLRFPNEFLHARANKAMLVRVTRPELEVPTDAADTALNGWDGEWDLTVENNSDLGALYNEAVAFCDGFLKGYYR